MADHMQLLSFDNFAQRVLYRYAYIFADFHPLASGDVPVEAQRAFYDFCGAVLRGIANDPTLLGLSVDHPDQWLPPHHVMSMYPDVYKVRNAAQKAANELSNLVYTAGLLGVYGSGTLTMAVNSVPQMTAKTLGILLALLERFGMHVEKSNDMLTFTMPTCPEALATWPLLAKQCSTHPGGEKEYAVRCMLWMHDEDDTYFLERLKTLLGLDDGFFAYVAEKYTANGYRKRMSVNEYGANYTYAKGVGGLNIEYSTLWPTVRFVNLTSIGVKATLEHANELEKDIKGQLIRFCKPCNDCLGCTKSGKNKQFTVVVLHDGQNHRLCPEFVQMEWYNNDISRDKIDFMLELNELQERYGKNWKKTQK